MAGEGVGGGRAAWASGSGRAAEEAVLVGGQ